MADETGHLPRRPARIIKATVWSMQGLRAAWLHESSFRLEIYLLAVLAPLALWLGQDGVERALLLGSCLLVPMVELLNSALEAATTATATSSTSWWAGPRTWPGGIRGDVNCGVVWALVLLPRWPAPDEHK